MAEPFTIYQITILYMLDRADFPLTNTQIAKFFLDQDYTDYFRVQEVLYHLREAELVGTRSTHSNTQYFLTPAGRETLGYFRDKITDGIAADVAHFFDKNQLSMKSENSIVADYYKTNGSKYAVRCQVLSDKTAVIDLTLTVNTKEQAQIICANWKNQNQDVYACLMDMLLQ